MDNILSRPIKWTINIEEWKRAAERVRDLEAANEKMKEEVYGRAYYRGDEEKDRT